MPASTTTAIQPEARLPAELQLARGDAQVAVVGQALADSLEVRVLDQHREPPAGVEVEFTVTAGEGALSRSRAGWRRLEHQEECTPTDTAVA